jgi:hypothetical protein
VLTDSKFHNIPAVITDEATLHRQFTARQNDDQEDNLLNQDGWVQE